jgi:hypothetical protein
LCPWRHRVDAATRRIKMAEEPENTDELAPDAPLAGEVPEPPEVPTDQASEPAADVAAVVSEAPIVPDDLVPDVPADEEPSKPANPILAIVVGVLAVALVASAGYFGFKALSGGSDAHAQVDVAVAFTQAMLAQDTAGIKKYIPSDALKRVSDAQWAALDASAAQTAITFEKPTWSGETETLKLAASGQAGVITAVADPKAANSVTLSLSGAAFGGTIPGSCVLVRDGSEWKISQFTIADTTLKFDAANISNTMGSEATTGAP